MEIEPQHMAPRGINPLVYGVLNALWWRYGYVSNFTVHTQGWRK